MTRPAPWTDEENTAGVALYFVMLDHAMAGEKYNKAAMIRKAQLSGDEALGNRSRGSIEAKLMNCTAAHRDLYPGDTTMNDFGYRALPNYQASLKVAINDKLNERHDEGQQALAQLNEQRAGA